MNPYSNALYFQKAYFLPVSFISLHSPSPPTFHRWCIDVCEWQKVQMRGKVRSSSASCSWHCITSHSWDDVLWFPSVFSEAPQRRGGAFFHPFPSTFAWRSLLGVSLKHRITQSDTQVRCMVLMYTIIYVLSKLYLLFPEARNCYKNYI